MPARNTWEAVKAAVVAPRLFLHGCLGGDSVSEEGRLPVQTYRLSVAKQNFYARSGISSACHLSAVELQAIGAVL